MKIVFLNVLLLWVANSALAVDYICRGDEGEPVVEIVEVEGRPQFRYLVDGETHLSLPMNRGSVQWITQLPIGFEVGKVLIFRPGWGETIVHIYGRIRSWGAVFDIFVSGMLGNVQKTLVDYECRVKAE